MANPTPAPSEPPYKIVPFSKSELVHALCNDEISQAEVESQERVEYLYQYLLAINAKSIVVENSYIDGDYLDDVATYYVKCFRRYRRKCHRLHFFATEVTDQQFLDIVTAPSNAATTHLREEYCGFVVARPLPQAVIGRTALRTYPPDGGRRNYTVVRKYEVNLFGLDLSVRSLAFQEQDRVVAACATVSLWCCFQVTSELFGTPLPTPAKITQSANKIGNITRPIPSHGLNVLQICNAIREVGLEAEVIEVTAALPLASLLYAHLRMGLPAILVVAIEGYEVAHAVTIAGYSIHKTRQNNTETGSQSPSTPMPGLRIDEFYAHDDQIGPFSKLIVKPSTTISSRTYPICFTSSWKDKNSGKQLAMYPLFVVVPVYPKIRVTFIDINEWVTRLNDLIQILSPKPGTEIEWDVHLVTNSELKRDLRSSVADTGMRREILLQHQPRFIWRATLVVDGVKALDLLADATDIAPSMPLYAALWYDQQLRAWIHASLAQPKLRTVLRDILTDRFVGFLDRVTAPSTSP